MSKKNHKDYVFNFQQFAISHCNSAMKVGTDGVLLGAWTPIKKAKKILDVGCGSGLIGLMLAQRSDTSIIGIEIDHLAAQEAKLNTTNSPWSNRINIINGDITLEEFQRVLPKVDLIVSNPPFFTETLKSPEKARSVARHESDFGVVSLIKIASAILPCDGRLCFIAPTERADEIEFTTAISKMHIIHRLDIQTIATKPPVRTIWELSMSDNNEYTHEIQALRENSGQYSEWYRTLTKDYYTHLK